MYRGTTPTHLFRINIDPTLIKTIKITYAQDDEDILSKKTEDCVVEDNIIVVKLTQEDTFRFKSDKLVRIQLRLLLYDGTALASRIITTTVNKCLDEEILV